MAREYADTLQFTTATDFLHYDGICWNESDEQALAVVQELTDRQLQEAETAEHVAWQKLKQSGGSDVLVGSGAAKAKKLFDAAQLAAFTQYAIAKEYKTFVIKRRDTKYLNSCLQAAKPMLQCKPTELDNNEFLLNTPLGTYYLPDGLCGIHPSTATDKITKVTEVSPGDNGKDLWRSAIDTFFCKDAELIEYVQQIVGLAAIGKVYVEALIIAYGEGRNGKSTFWNVISRVLGTYSGNISADTLTVGCRRNVKPEMAEAKGKRLLIAAELDEGMRLNTSIIKQLCSTDAVFAEKKYKDPFQFIPSHTLVLYTNHLPRVGANDPGTWRRLIVIPFNAHIEGNNDIKNYADYLLKNAGEYVLAWIIEGAQKIIQKKFQLTTPACVREAIGSYRENNDWLGHFLDECCELGKAYQEKSGDFYTAYRNFCNVTGDYVRNSADFYTVIEQAGIVRFRNRQGRFVRGIRLTEKAILN